MSEQKKCSDGYDKQPKKRPLIEFTTEYKADKDEWDQMCHGI